jgi:excisionase family DNA binding protein
MTETSDIHASRALSRAVVRVSYGVREIAASMGVSEGFIRLEIVRGRLKTFRRGRRVLVSQAAFSEYTDGARANEAR